MRSHLTPAQVRAYRLVDNRLAELSGWDEELLAGELHALNSDGFDLSLVGFDEAALDRLMAPLDEEREATGDSAEVADESPEPSTNPVSRPGDLWVMGDHHLLCGDSTDPSAVMRVMNGARATLVFTSPPYGNQRDYTTGGVGDWDTLMRGIFAALPVTEVGTASGQSRSHSPRQRVAALLGRLARLDAPAGLAPVRALRLGSGSRPAGRLERALGTGLRVRFCARTNAKGIETPVVLKAVHKMGFDLGQGDLFGKAMDAQRFARTVLRRQPR